MMAHTFTVFASWDAEAKVFTTTSDIPGLVLEADSLEELVELVEELAPDMVAANLPHADRPYKVQLETRRDLAVA